jgi:ABC-2 type transport system permease protein
VESAIFGQAIREYLRPRRVVPWIFLGILCMLMANYWSWLQDGATAEDSYANVSSIFVYHILALTSAIFTTAIISQEVEQKTIVYLLTRPVPRWKLVTLRYLASSIVVAVIGMFCAVLASIGAFHGITNNPLLVKDCVALVVGAFAYGALFLLISLMFNRAMIICLLFAFGWETAVPNMPGQMYYLSIFSYLQGIAQHPSAGNNKLLALLTGGAGDNTLTANASYAVMAIFVCALVAGSAWWFTNFEYLPREDAE